MVRRLPIRVLLLTHGLPIGGTEAIVCHLARRFNASGAFEVEIGCLDEVGGLGEQLRAEGIRVTCYHRRPGFDLRVPWQISKHVRCRSIQLIHAHQATCYAHGVLAKLICSVPIVFTEHGRFHPDVVSLRQQMFNRIFSRFVDHTTAVSMSVRESLRSVERFVKTDVEIIPNGIDLERFRVTTVRRRDARHRLGVPDSTAIIGTVGRLDPIKNHSLLLRAFAHLRQNRPDLMLAIVGDGPERPHLEALVADLHLKDTVLFLGARSDVPEVLWAFDVFALSSFSEGVPVTLIEAMAASVPIVTTGVGGIREMLDHEVDAYIVDVSNSRDCAPSVFADALQRVLLDQSLRISLTTRALARAHRDFSLDTMVTRYRSVYERVLANRV